MPGERARTALPFRPGPGRGPRRWLAGKPIEARRAGRLERGWRWCRRNPALALVGGLALLAVVAVAVVSLLWAIQQTEAAQALRQQQQQTARALERAERQAASLALDRGLGYCEQGEVGLGLLWLGRSLEIAARAGAADLDWAIRVNLAS